MRILDGFVPAENANNLILTRKTLWCNQNQKILKGLDSPNDIAALTHLNYSRVGSSIQKTARVEIKISPDGFGLDLESESINSVTPE